MNLNLNEQRVIVFGAAQGIGLAIAKCFQSEQCRVVAVDRKLPTDGESHNSIDFVSGDVTVLDEMQELADSHQDVQHVVFCVGASSGRVGFPYWNVHPKKWSHVVDVNLMGAVNVAHAFGPLLAEHRQGSLQFLTSVAGQIGSQTDPPYSAAKAALINFMQCVAKDLAPFSVRCNALSPGMVQTELNRAVWEASKRQSVSPSQETYEEWAEQKIRRIAPLGKWQSAGEIAAMSVFLASDHARNITGQTINIDGGQVMHA